MTQEQKCDEHGKKIDKLFDYIKEIKDALLGTYDKKGAITQIKENRDSIDAMKKLCDQHQKSKNNFFDWAFRAVITILISIILMKVGLK